MSFNSTLNEQEPLRKNQQEAERGKPEDASVDKNDLPALAFNNAAAAPPHVASRRYRYSSLPSPTSIRLIELQPGKESDPISCSLQCVELADAQYFEALSYMWGARNGTIPIFCFDHGSSLNPKDSTILVISNCLHALRRLRFEDKIRILWIDAICINQNQRDQGEKSQQAPLMGNLYRRAGCVLVYLEGEDFVEISAAFQLFKSLAIKMTSFPEGLSTLTAVDGVPLQAILSFQKFFSRTLFKRCWTLQEIGLARKAILICDGDKLEWDLFFSVISWINKYHPLDVMQLRLPTQEVATSSECTDPHDRIYAFLGHPTAMTEERPLIQPSYIRNTWVVFYEFAISYLLRTQNLRILSAVDHRERLLPPTFPLSWIPWWNTSPWLCNFGFSSLYRASEGSESFKSIKLKGKSLEDLDIEEVMEDSPLFEWYDLMISSSASLEDLKLVQQQAFSTIMNYQAAKMMSNLFLPAPSPSNVLELYQPGEAKLTARGLIIDEMNLTCPVLDREDLTMHSFAPDRDLDEHIIERLCSAIEEKQFPARYEDSLLALSLTLVAGMHNSELIKDVEAHKESFDAYRYAVQNSRAREIEQGERQEFLIQVVAEVASAVTSSVPDSVLYHGSLGAHGKASWSMLLEHAMDADSFPLNLDTLAWDLQQLAAGKMARCYAASSLAPASLSFSKSMGIYTVW